MPKAFGTIPFNGNILKDTLVGHSLNDISLAILQDIRAYYVSIADNERVKALNDPEIFHNLVIAFSEQGIVYSFDY